MTHSRSSVADPQPVVLFLDQDHVLDLLARLLRWREPGDPDQAFSFFEPEAVDRSELKRIGEPLRGRVEVANLEAFDEVDRERVKIIVTRRGVVDRGVIARFPKVRLVQRLGVGLGLTDATALRERRIALACLSRPSLVHVAEHVILLTLALLRKLGPALAAMEQDGAAEAAPGTVAYNWTDMRGIRTISGSSFGIFGMGEIGQLLAERVAKLGGRVAYHSRNRLARADEEALGATFVDLDTLLGDSDILSLHCPPTPENIDLIDRRMIARMRPGALLINTARGSIVDEDALYDALSSGHLGGAALDVHAAEPRAPNDRFHALPNVVLTPHIAGGERTAVLGEMSVIVENIVAALAREGQVVDRIAKRATPC